MNNLARISSLVAALCLAIPATGFSHDHGDHGGHGGSNGNWHGGGGSWHGGGHGYYSHGHSYGYGSHVHFYGYGGYSPFYSYYPYYSAPYYDGGYAADAYYDGDAPDAPAPTYRGARVEDHGDNLAVDVQRALRHDGYYHGGIDGDIGAGTRAAIRQYQYDHSLEVTGRIDKALLRSMGLD